MEDLEHQEATADESLDTEDDDAITKRIPGDPI
jgi:hypothetical protein